ncbi:MICOS complex subunit MIC13 [Octopus bimaculoides]|uniref:MICOS complex subunit MIC13 n=1 Tax=Octopus bimaculoides TaxID=37653 RepID=A0A0L8GVS1_OCTBM|nr:MICOS complex subunit MIC13 [Octopus bimaculoides]|eukprot:XP_014777641.1 PREDICTED: MICOS complex subunit MIC13-like [Octopus bimaculoides]
MATFSNVVINSAKVAITGGAVYYTVKQGVWSDTGEGSAALENVRETILPATATEYISKIPSPGNAITSGLGMWNGGVQTMFNFIANIPSNVKYYSKLAVTEAVSVVKGS